MPTQSPSDLHFLNPVAVLSHHTTVVLTAGTVVPQLLDHDRRLHGACGDHEEITVLTPHTVLIHG